MSRILVVPDAGGAVLRITGEDAFPYLQSQFSGDLRPAAKSGAVVYGLFLTRKGRVVADAFAMVLGRDELLLVSYYMSAHGLAAVISENIVADDVVVTVSSGSLGAVVGIGSAAELSLCDVAVPTGGGFTRVGDQVVFAGRRGGESFDVVGLSKGSGIMSRILDLHTASAASALEPVRIAAGIPRVPVDCGPGDLPQEAGLERDAVSFDKGCYLGQEVMARIKARGRPTRFLTRVMLPAPIPAAALPISLWDGGSVVGEIRSAACVDEGCVAFAMMRGSDVSAWRDCSLSSEGPPVVRLYPSV